MVVHIDDHASVALKAELSVEVHEFHQSCCFKRAP